MPTVRQPKIPGITKRALVSSDQKKGKKAKGQKGKKRKPAEKRKIESGDSIAELVRLFPKADEILAAYGLFCQHCVQSDIDTLEEGARLHGLTDDDIWNLVDDLNEMAGKEPKKPRKISITFKAAEALKIIAREENKTGQALRVTADESGRFCMEFEPKAGKDDFVFSHQKIPEMSLIASASALKRIGGSKIDFKNGKFTLDLDHICGDCDGSCGCS
ncbi:hypothetical protein A3A67_02675 [Candidatus Peribacteria bacterium RIFCSPLOWO2_01_FULL_51_18]|nr:MAG: hypothetical protein A3C52_03570 [Candidatus Peribacteria bacterium RIFCSPHIGHO2_02_FULL_51_15]OGJ66915.1 MAG: hypothetical protein A3A67_02675 [Candidatus Peribacteria bacterium RIFCSPLOWO2_01_FULL_51_18]OGJ67678.1 MAG: hypothetical protein A3J34_01100 [Candidatus Peribacteria bacterium RIFCSPLOWO2_02_FULL_51_10]